MALRAIVLGEKLKRKKQELDEARQARAALDTRGEELEAELDSASVESASDEELDTLDSAVDSLNAEKSDADGKIESLQRELEEIEKQIADEEEKQKQARDKAVTITPKTPATRKDDLRMNRRDRVFGNMSYEQRQAFVAQPDVQEFLSAYKKRDITNTELIIPETVLGLITETIDKSSKLLKYLNVVNVSGTSRQRVMGTFPEAVWTEMKGVTLNELGLQFNDVEIDGFKVGGFIPAYNEDLADNDVNLTSIITTALSQAIGYALDKAILYGKGKDGKMPLGIMTRLAQTSEPSDYSSTSRTWEDLSSSNITSSSNTGLELMQDLVTATKNMKNNYVSNGTKFWAMNQATYTDLLVTLMSINASGALVTGMQTTMPLIGGNIEILDFIPDSVIIGGYGELYLMAQRAGIILNMSEHVRFLQDETLYKATARYDGTPVIAEGFIAFGMNGVTPDDSMDFAEDTANS